MASKPIFFSLFLFFFFQMASSESLVKGAYWFPESGFPLSDIDSTHFTHIFYAFADLDRQTNQLTIPDSNLHSVYFFSQTIRRRNPSVKPILSIGGGNPNKTAAFSSMASNPSSRKTFIQSSIRLARSYNFLGLDLDWEYPSTPTDMANMGALFREWKTELRTESQSTGKTELLLSAAVFYSSDHYSVIYPVQSMATSLDWINVMSYDFYGPLWSGVTGPPAALFGGEVNGDNGISKWVQAGMPARKIVLGFPFYGYAWELEDERNHGYFTKTNGAAISEDGSIGYNQIRRWIVENDAATVYDGSVKGDYCYSGTTWIGYDDMQSIVEKVRYAKQRGLLGYFAWHVGIDDNWGLSKRASQEWNGGVRIPEEIKQTLEEKLFE